MPCCTRDHSKQQAGLTFCLRDSSSLTRSTAASVSTMGALCSLGSALRKDAAASAARELCTMRCAHTQLQSCALEASVGVPDVLRALFHRFGVAELSERCSFPEAVSRVGTEQLAPAVPATLPCCGRHRTDRWCRASDAEQGGTDRLV